MFYSRAALPFLGGDSTPLLYGAPKSKKKLHTCKNNSKTLSTLVDNESIHKIVSIFLVIILLSYKHIIIIKL